MFEMSMLIGIIYCVCFALKTDTKSERFEELPQKVG